MLTEPSSTDLLPEPPGVLGLGNVRKAVTDVVPLLRFRGAMLRGRSRRAAGLGMAVILAMTIASTVAPALIRSRPFPSSEVALILPTTYLSVLVISVVSAIAAGGGRELLNREHALAFPVSPVTDHLGALIMAPLNIAWLLQIWSMLGVTAYVVGPSPWLVVAQIPVLAWVLVATSVAQVLAWGVEWVRRGPRGVLLVRLLALCSIGLLAWLIVTDRLVNLLDNSPTLAIALAVLAGARGDLVPWLVVVVELFCVAAGAVVCGALLNIAVSRRAPHEELRQETSTRRSRRHPASDLEAVIRIDRASIWRSVPLRRGLSVLSIMPGLVALATGLSWDMICLLPGLVASGGTLLFGVNVFCLDGRGALWRDSLPVHPRLLFGSRVLVLAEVLASAIGITLALGSFRAGPPSASQLAAVLSASLVATLQVLSGSLRWSVRRPYAVDLRGARATPAPPLVMVGYSTRLALASTTTGLLFAATSMAPWWWSLVFATPLAAISLWRLTRVAREWSDPLVRGRVVATVAS